MRDDDLPAWQPAGFELLNVEHLFEDAVFEKMEALCPDTRSEQQPLRIAVLNIAGWLNADLHYEARPSGADLKQTKLKPLAAALARVDAALNDLDHDARAAVVKAATVYSAIDESSFPSQHESAFNPGPARYRGAVERIEDMRRWVDRAVAAHPPSKGGRPTQEAKNRAVIQLRDLWHERTGSRPSRRNWEQDERLNTFNLFCALALAPVLSANELDTQVDHAVRLALGGVEKTPSD